MEVTWDETSGMTSPPIGQCLTVPRALTHLIPLKSCEVCEAAVITGSGPERWALRFTEIMWQVWSHRARSLTQETTFPDSVELKRIKTHSSLCIIAGAIYEGKRWNYKSSNLPTYHLESKSLGLRFENSDMALFIIVIHCWVMHLNQVFSVKFQICKWALQSCFLSLKND